MDLVDERTRAPLKRGFMSRHLYQGLVRQGVVFNKTFEDQTREEKLRGLCQVFGVEATDPDDSYELTYDNIMKMLAITTRFRANIPVVMMGETGSGKTRLIRFMCALMRGGRDGVKNMLIMKVHGGVESGDVNRVVKKAIEVARNNSAMGVSPTVLFFDEANTTGAIGTIKTIICDRLVEGAPIPDGISLQFIAAVNPYREHSPDMIRKLEMAGLGYHIDADKTRDRIGKIPLRRLVYRDVRMNLTLEVN